MSSLFFPQLLSGALAQYPIEKKTEFRSVVNVMPDGTVWAFEDPGATRSTWQLSYVELEQADITALQSHFAACRGPIFPFTFIDPTANMLAQSSDLTATPWIVDSGLVLQANAADPLGGSAGFSVTNIGQAPLAIKQVLSVPANYQYCFSLYAFSSGGATVTLSRTGVVATDDSAHYVGNSWTRLVSSGRLNEASSQISFAATMQPGQQVTLFGLQAEAQSAPSRYMATTQRGGVYSKAHWASSDFPVVAQSPGLYATSFAIEAS